MKTIVSKWLIMIFLTAIMAGAYAEPQKCLTWIDLPEQNESADIDYLHVNTAPLHDVTDQQDLCDGWPVNLSSPGAGFPYTPTLFDINGDGASEIFLTGGETFGLSGDGSFLPGWPTSEMAYMGYGTNAQLPGPSCADVDTSGTVEILWSERDWYAGSAHMWTFNGRNDDGTDMTGFPKTAPDESSNALNIPFVLGDSDGDGYLEAWTAHTLGNTGAYYRIYCLDHLGNLKFTTDLDPDEQILNLYFGDVDDNAQDEFFAVTLFNGEFRLHLFNSLGEEQAGYPVGLFSPGSGYLMNGSPIPVDLDADGNLEIILGYWTGSASYAVARHHDGTPVSGFPITVATSSQLFYLGLGDITGDGTPELLAFDNHLGGNYRAWAIDLATGAPLSGWPFDLPNWPKGFPTVVDVDDDSVQEICFVTDGGQLYAVSSDGATVSGYPKSMSAPSISGVSAGDIDGDGYYELVAATWDGWVYAWDTDGSVGSDRSDWPMRGVDARNTGIFTGSSSTGIEPANPVLQSFTPVANPARGAVEFLLPELSSATMDIYDLSGHRMACMDASGLSRLQWHPGRDVPAGVYMARLSSGGTYMTARVILLR